MLYVDKQLFSITQFIYQYVSSAFTQLKWIILKCYTGISNLLILNTTTKHFPEQVITRCGLFL